MIRNDGKYTIFILQFKHLRKPTEDEGEWNYAGDGEQFCKGDGDFREEPRCSFNALGDCWQQTGVNGTYDYDIAHQMLLMASKNSPGRKFRIARMEISQQTIEVCQIKTEKT